jgi:hypothetical protein
MRIISRKEARALGLTHYFTGKRCKRGHVAERYVCDYACVECHRGWDRAHRDLKDEWARINLERVRRCGVGPLK